MEESTSWKNHSFTLLIFGGIVIVCSIFFVLGMLVGRSQGQRIAELAFAEEAANKPVAENAGDEFPLNYYSETTGEKPELTLQAPEAAPVPRPDPPAAAFTPPAIKPASAEPPAAKSAVKPTPNSAAQISTTTKNATAKPTAAKAAPVVGQVYLQVFATKNQKQAYAEQKRVQSKGFKAKVVTDAKLHRVYVGPYEKSAINLAKSDLKAKGFGDVVVKQ